MDNTKTPNMISTEFFVIAVILVSRILGFSRDIFIGSRLGVSYLVDVYMLATTIPATLFGLFWEAVGTSYIPIFSKILTCEGEKKGLSFTNNLLNVTFIISLLMSILGIVFASPIVSLIAKGLPEHVLSLAISLTRISFVMVIFWGVTYVCIGFLQSNNQFIIPAGINIPNNIIIVILLLLPITANVKHLMWAGVAGMFLQVVVKFLGCEKRAIPILLMWISWTTIWEKSLE